ncbi:hypothetical protein [Paenibacillus lautus]|uniref:hypothetical protein n=1 Tax=Paenibacillus lautus TaxID=1401 RepID=UPI001142FF5B|nr:hypothetical protein [Paenibacillus lautus]
MNQRRGRIDSGKALALARKFSNGKLASKALTRAEFLPLQHSFRKFGDNSDWRNDTAAQRASTSLPSPKLKGEDVLAIDLT